MIFVYRISSLPASARGRPPLTIGFLAFGNRHQIRLNPDKSRVEALTLIDHSHAGFGFGGFSERAEKLVGCHLLDGLGIDTIVLSEAPPPRVQAEDGVPDPGILQDLLAIQSAWH